VIRVRAFANRPERATRQLNLSNRPYGTGHPLKISQAINCLATIILSLRDAEPLQHPDPLRGCNSDLAQYSNTPTLHHSNTPSLRHSNTPSLHHSITPSLHHSITPSLHHSITPSLRAAGFEDDDSLSDVAFCGRWLAVLSASEVGRTKRLGRTLGNRVVTPSS
jgi:hypothetical protein